MPDIRYITATTGEDPSVGIFAAEFLVDLGGKTYVEPEDVEPLRKALADALGYVAEIAGVEFDFETEKRQEIDEPL